jgi:hypothetical protein
VQTEGEEKAKADRGEAAESVFFMALERWKRE